MNRSTSPPPSRPPARLSSFVAGCARLRELTAFGNQLDRHINDLLADAERCRRLRLELARELEVRQ